MIAEVEQDARERMSKSVEALRHELAKIRTGRAHTALLDQVTVDYYGSQVPINQAASVKVEDARTLSVTPWEKNMVPVVEKAILNADLGLNPATAGMVIRVPIPPMTEERRRELVKKVKHEAEQGKVAVRNVRRDCNAHLKQMLKDKEITEDDSHQGEQAIQKLTNEFVEQIDQTVNAKEKELMEI